MDDQSHSSLKPVLRIDFPFETRLGHGKIELLEHIRQTGSIAAAGRAMDMSYRRAWLLVAEMNRMFLMSVVERQRGGDRGGRASLTPFGEELILRFRAMEDRMRAALADDLAWLASSTSKHEAATPKDRNQGQD
ncbi:winged helix-turn-helix domain-containing protein [Oryzifoliimicrobium ureilyticus]|uniref:winged helix-turn-helix domain-containing protein n=1 Tax=Oryzifoliimicrobium ureilyticus TaxID=3113724 RepID=UPI003076698B